MKERMRLSGCADAAACGGIALVRAGDVLSADFCGGGIFSDRDSEMRKKELKLVVTFHTTADAMAMERMCRDDGLPGRLIPVPRLISASCGLSWCAGPEDEALLAEAMRRHSIDREGIYKVLI